MAFPHSTMPTLERVHPTPLYEALAAFAIAGLLWRLRRRWQPLHVVASYLLLSGAARAVVEVVRINDRLIAGLTQPQLWSLTLVAAGAVIVAVSARRGETAELMLPPRPGAAEKSVDRLATDR